MSKMPGTELGTQGTELMSTAGIGETPCKSHCRCPGKTSDDRKMGRHPWGGVAYQLKEEQENFPSSHTWLAGRAERCPVRERPV